jgi:hypothetical protein
VEKDAYVLCRVFHKNNIGPPNSHRYAPFVEEEWDDGTPALVPGKEAGNEVVAGHDACAEEAGCGAFVEQNGHCPFVENNCGECVENRQDSFVEGNNFEQVCFF